jgi:hypothetical protein
MLNQPTTLCVRNTLGIRKEEKTSKAITPPKFPSHTSQPARIACIIERRAVDADILWRKTAVKPESGNSEERETLGDGGLSTEAYTHLLLYGTT